MPSPVDDLRQASSLGVIRVEFWRQRGNAKLKVAPGGGQMTFVGVDNRSPCRAPVRSTADRVTAAWHHSPPLARRSMTAACATSVALAFAAMRVTAVLALTTATVGVLLATAAFVDSHERRVPNRLLAVALVVALAGATQTNDLAIVRNSLLGLVIAVGLMLLVRLTRGVGMGDVKMAGVVGASVGAVASGLHAAPVAIAISAFAAATYGHVAGRQKIALGPSLWLGWASAFALVSIGWFS